MSEMYFHQEFCDLYCYLRLCKEPSHNFLFLEVLFLVILNLLPDFFRKINMFRRCLHPICRQGTLYINAGHICRPLDFTGKHCHIPLAFCLSILCKTAEKCVYIIFYIDPVISVCQPDLSYVPRHGKRFLYCSLIFLVLLINDLYHLISPLQPQA